MKSIKQPKYHNILGKYGYKKLIDFFRELRLNKKFIKEILEDRIK